MAASRRCVRLRRRRRRAGDGQRSAPGSEAASRLAARAARCRRGGHRDNPRGAVGQFDAAEGPGCPDPVPPPADGAPLTWAAGEAGEGFEGGNKLPGDGHGRGPAGVGGCPARTSGASRPETAPARVLLRRAPGK